VGSDRRAASALRMRPTITQLEYFVALARTLNFRKAAGDCHVTQPALSAQIQKLEQTLGVQLFERDRRRVLLTAVGRRLVQRAEELLAATDDLVAVASQAANDPLAGPLRLGVIPTIAPYALPRIVPAIRKHHRELKLLVREGQTETLLTELGRGELDVVLLALEVPMPQSVETLALFSDAFLVAVPKDHPFAKRDSVRIQDLEGEEVLVLEDGHCLADQAMEVCRRALGSTTRFGDFRASSLATLVQMVVAGLGITLLPEMAADAEKRQNRTLAIVPFAGKPPKRTVGFAWRRGNARADAFRSLAELIESLV
jgi:LysR family hydrogen peroxide-inducible transcriptional activator